jgi:hypothetical protein
MLVQETRRDNQKMASMLMVSKEHSMLYLQEAEGLRAEVAGELSFHSRLS